MGLQNEIKRRRPFELAEEEAFLNLLRTTAALSADVEQLFKDAGLSAPQYNVLRILRGAGADGLAITEIAARMITRVPDITRLVNRLETARLVSRCGAPSDRRVAIIQITSRALEILRALDVPLRELHRRQLSHLSRKELDELNRLLVKARHPPDGRQAEP